MQDSFVTIRCITSFTADVQILIHVLQHSQCSSDHQTNTLTLQAKDLQRIYDFVAEHVPHAILVPGNGQHSQTLYYYLHSLTGSILREKAQVLSGRSETGHISVKFVDQSVAQLWETSVAAKEELTDQPPLVRRAVAIARSAIQGQLPVICSLAGTHLCCSQCLSLALSGASLSSKLAHARNRTGLVPMCAGVLD